MKKRIKSLITLVLLFIICLTVLFASCGSRDADSDTATQTSAEETTALKTAEEPEGAVTEENEVQTEAGIEYQTEVVTDENGEAVTDADGNALTELVTDQNGKAITAAAVETEKESVSTEEETTEEPEGTTAAETTEKVTTTKAETTTQKINTAKSVETTTQQEAATKNNETTTISQTTYTFTEANETLMVVSDYGADFWSTAEDAVNLKTTMVVKHIDLYTEVTLTGICREASYVYRITYNGVIYYTYGSDYLTPEVYEAEQESIRIANQATLCKEMLTLVNELREANGLDPLIWSEEMEEGTLIRAEELYESFSHTRPDGTSCSTVFSYMTAGVLYGGENICGTASWNGTAQKAFEAWCNSEGHLANMLGEGYTYFCCAYSYKGSFWVQEFGYAY